jgi:hypothetical protein
MNKQIFESRCCRVLRLLVALVVLTSGARAATIFNNINTSNNYNGDNVSGYVAVKFTASMSFTLTSVAFDLYNTSFYDRTVSVYLLTDANSDGRPDALYATLSSITLPAMTGSTYSTGIFSSTPASSLLLNKNTNYWITLYYPSSSWGVTWAGDGTSAVSRNVSSSLTGPYGAAASKRYGLAVYGTPTPEPEPAILLGLGLVAGVTVRLRRRKSA